MKQGSINNILSFMAGVGVGSAIMYKVLKTKYDKLIQEEIDSVKEAFSKKEETTIENSELPRKDSDKNMYKKENQRIIEQNSYDTESVDKGDNEEEEDDVVESTLPYVIRPDEYGDSDYPTITLWYYTDGVVTNDAGKVIKNVEELIGCEYVHHFGEYEEDPDAVYVRNEDQEVDYEVLKEYRAYSDIEE